MAHVKRPAVRCKEPAKRRAINDATEARLKEAKAAVNNFPSFATSGLTLLSGRRPQRPILLMVAIGL
jgi:hypothetical protein